MEWQHRGIVRWSETDASGRFHFSSAFTWAEETEHALYRALIDGLMPDNLPRRSVGATFNAPFEAGDAYLVRLWIEKLGSSSISYRWVIEKDKALAIEGHHVAVHLDEDGRPSPVPEALRAGLAPYVKAEDDE